MCFSIWTKARRKYIHKNENNFVRVGIFGALVVIVVLIDKIKGFDVRFVRSTLQSLSQPQPRPGLEFVSPGSAWMPSSSGLGPSWLFWNECVSCPWMWTTRPAASQQTQRPLHSQWHWGLCACHLGSTSLHVRRSNWPSGQMITVVPKLTSFAWWLGLPGHLRHGSRANDPRTSRAISRANLELLEPLTKPTRSHRDGACDLTQGARSRLSTAALGCQATSESQAPRPWDCALRGAAPWPSYLMPAGARSFRLGSETPQCSSHSQSCWSVCARACGWNPLTPSLLHTLCIYGSSPPSWFLWRLLSGLHHQPQACSPCYPFSKTL